MKLNEYFGHWEEVRVGLLETLDGFKPEDLDFQPFEDSWSVRRISVHIANTEDGWLRYIVQQVIDEWPEWPELEATADLETIKQKLSAVHAQTMSYLGELDVDAFNRVFKAPWGGQLKVGWCFWHVLEHEIHHRGELSLVLGLLGREGLDV
jgi:uncharacterized damage-inducible protein DinB